MSSGSGSGSSGSSSGSGSASSSAGGAFGVFKKVGGAVRQFDPLETTLVKGLSQTYRSNIWGEGLEFLPLNQHKKAPTLKPDHSFMNDMCQPPPKEPSHRFRELYAECRRNKTKWEDPDFYGDKALGDLGGDSANAKDQKNKISVKDCEWKRLGEVPAAAIRDKAAIGDKKSRKAGKLYPPSLWVEIEPSDISQGSIGDCWFVASIAALSYYDGAIESLFSTKKINPYGIYEVAFFNDGEWQQVIVDDRVPFKPGKKSQIDKEFGDPYFAKLTSGNEIWVAIMEKAFAKLVGSYAAMEFGGIAEGVANLTGGVAFTLTNSDYEPKVLFERVKTYISQGVILGVGGTGHALSLLDAQEIDGDQILRLRNPWGRGDDNPKYGWTGKWSDYDTEHWTRKNRRKLKHTLENDGDYWIPVENFMEKFKTIHGCRIFMRHDYKITQYVADRGATANIATDKSNTIYLNVSVMLNRLRGTDLHKMKLEPTVLMVKAPTGEILAKAKNKGRDVHVDVRLNWSKLDFTIEVATDTRVKGYTVRTYVQRKSGRGCFRKNNGNKMVLTGNDVKIKSGSQSKDGSDNEDTPKVVHGAGAKDSDEESEFDHEIRCDNCQKAIAGIRYKCANCDFDLCVACEGRSHSHTRSHTFFKLRKKMVEDLALPDIPILVEVASESGSGSGSGSL